MSPGKNRVVGQVLPPGGAVRGAAGVEGGAGGRAAGDLRGRAAQPRQEGEGGREGADEEEQEEARGDPRSGEAGQLHTG